VRLVETRVRTALRRRGLRSPRACWTRVAEEVAGQTIAPLCPSAESGLRGARQVWASDVTMLDQWARGAARMLEMSGKGRCAPCDASLTAIFNTRISRIADHTNGNPDGLVARVAKPVREAPNRRRRAEIFAKAPAMPGPLGK